MKLDSIKCLFSGSILLGTLACPALSLAASLPAAPSGFTWQFASAATYSDSDTGSVSLNASGSFGAFSVTPISQSLSLTTFNEASAPSGQFYCVTASTFTSSLIGSTGATLFNFSGSASSFSGNLSLSGLTIANPYAGTSSGSSSLVNTSTASIPAFGSASFLDAASGAASTTINLTNTGTVAANNGSNITFNYTGNSVAYFTPASGSYSGPGWAVSGSAGYSAALTTNYDIYELVPVSVPEPAGLSVILLAGAMATGVRRRKTNA